MNTKMTAAIAALSIAGLSLATPALAFEASDFQHRVTVPSGDAQLTAVYQPRTLISYRQIGNMTPNRPSTARCLWKAEVSVERHLQPPAGQGSHMVRTLVPTKLIEGQTIGRCAQGKQQVSAAIARRSDEVRAHVLAVAAEDHTALMAELDAGRSNTAG